MLVIKHYLEEVDCLIHHKLYVASLWYCRLLMDVILHLCLKEAVSSKEIERVWKEFNKEERQDRKIQKVCKLIGKKFDDYTYKKTLYRMIASVRALERGKLNFEKIEDEALNARKAVVKLTQYCNRLIE